MFKKKVGYIYGILGSKGGMHTNACKIDCMTKLYIGKDVFLAIVSGNYNNEVETDLNNITIINLMFCNCNTHVYLLSFFFYL